MIIEQLKTELQSLKELYEEYMIKYGYSNSFSEALRYQTKANEIHQVLIMIKNLELNESK